MIFLIMIIAGESPDHLADPARKRERDKTMAHLMAFSANPL